MTRIKLKGQKTIMTINMIFSKLSSKRSQFVLIFNSVFIPNLKSDIILRIVYKIFNSESKLMIHNIYYFYAVFFTTISD